MATTGGTLARFKNPEYTGANRCLPCTVVNTLIAAVLAVGVGVGVGTVAGAAPGAVTGLAAFGVSVAAIYFRGYLVPGTPTLTKRYFPPWLLALFGKGRADVGAARTLAGRDGNWEQYTILERSQLLNGLRLFIDTCPACGGEPNFGTETVQSCCSTHEVAAVACEECGARLFESAT